MPNDRPCRAEWILAAAAVLLCGLWLSGPAALSAPSAAAQHPADALATEVRKPRAVPPEGWRRTSRGWERLMAAPIPSINDEIARQLQAESSWPIHGLLQRLRRVNPISLAAGQIAIACLIALAAKPRQTPLAAGRRVPRSSDVTAAPSTPGPALPRTS